MTRATKIAVSVLALGLSLPPIGILAAGYLVDYPTRDLNPALTDPLVVLDANGDTLRSVPKEEGGRRWRWVGLDEVDPRVVLTLLASEDKDFYEHGGVDLPAIGRSVYLNLKEGGLNYGASTITMQLMRMVHSQGMPRSVWNKVRETVLALRLERAVAKNFILEQYLNRAYFGNGAFGIEAAARKYFGKAASMLSLGEATYLMVLPRGPSFYDPIRHHERALERRDHLLGLLVSAGSISGEEATRTKRFKVEPVIREYDFEARHFVDWVLGSLPKEVRDKGGTVRTTLDLDLQRALERRTRHHVETLKPRGVQQAGVVVLESGTGRVLAMVGSAGEGSPYGQVNISTRRRYPGSALKPFVYGTAIEGGDSPATIAYDIYDVPSAYRVKGNPPKQRGPARFKEALAGSYNLAAVHVLEKVGVERVMEKLRDAGVAALELSGEDYGLRLALGSAKVRLVDLAAGYLFTVRGGTTVEPTGVTEVEFDDGTKWKPPSRAPRVVFSERVSWLVMDMLSDPEARRFVFGNELPADLPYKVVAKTGTARGFSDVVAVFATREFTVAAWAGRFDGGPTKGVWGMDGAGPLARAGLLLAGRGEKLTLPEKPDGIVSANVCPLSGMLASRDCPHSMVENFIEGTVPQTRCDWHRRDGGAVVVKYPDEVLPWVRRNRKP